MSALIVLGRTGQIAQRAILQTRDFEMQSTSALRTGAGLLFELSLASDNQVFGVLDAGQRGLVSVTRNTGLHQRRRVAGRLLVRAERQRFDHGGAPSLTELTYGDRHRCMG